MRNTLIALALAATTAQAEMRYSSEHNTVYGDSSRYNDAAFNVSVSPTTDCKPKINFMTSTKKPVGDKQTIDFEIRVDRYSSWTIEDASMYVVRLSGSNVEAVTSVTSEKLISQLRRGTTLRVKWPIKGGGFMYDEYSLAGFSAAYAKAKAACTTCWRFL